MSLLTAGRLDQMPFKGPFKLSYDSLSHNFSWKLLVLLLKLHPILPLLPSGDT